MKKPTVYLDTSVISAYWYEGADVVMLVRRVRTREWWDFERRHFALWASVFGEGELRAGSYRRQRECLRQVLRLRYLTVTTDARSLSQEIVRRGLVPKSKEGDADHLAIAAVHGMDYLLTWNYAHMANAAVQTRFGELCEQMQLVAPLMVSPETIPQVRYGQSVERKHR